MRRRGGDVVNTLQAALVHSLVRASVHAAFWIQESKRVLLYNNTPRVRGWYQHLNSDVILGVRHFKAVSQTRFSN